jgi:hypothetical protein
MRPIILLLLLTSCAPEAITPGPASANSITGRYTAHQDGDTWQWRFIPGDRYNRGTLHTVTDSAANYCGLYFFSNDTDTLVLVSGILPVFRGRLFRDGEGYVLDGANIELKK